MGTFNYAGGNDSVPVQVGQHVGEDQLDDDNVDTDESGEDAGPSRVVNVRSGNARVGFQADGNVQQVVTIRM